MCLVYNKEATEKLQKEYNGRKTLTAYKIYEVKDAKLLPIYYGITIPLKHGKIISSRTVQEAGKDEDDNTIEDVFYVNRGIHVFLLKTEANEAIKWYYKQYGKYVIVPVTCYLSDLCGVNGVLNEAVFMSVRLSKKAYEEATK